MVSRRPIVQLLHWTGFAPTSAQIFRSKHLLDTEISSVLNSFLGPKVSCINVFRSGPAPNRSVKKNVTRNCHFGFELSLEFPDSCKWIPGTVQFDLLSPLRRTLLLPRSGLTSSEVRIQNSVGDSQSAPPIPCRQRSRWPRRL